MQAVENEDGVRDELCIRIIDDPNECCEHSPIVGRSLLHSGIIHTILLSIICYILEQAFAEYTKFQKHVFPRQNLDLRIDELTIGQAELGIHSNLITV